MQVAFILPAAISSSGLQAVAGVVREAWIEGLPLFSLALGSLEPGVCLDAEEVKSAQALGTNVMHNNNKIPTNR